MSILNQASFSQFDKTLITIRSMIFLFLSLVVLIVNYFKLRYNFNKTKNDGKNPYDIKFYVRTLVEISFSLFLILHLLKLLKYGFNFPINETIVTEDNSIISFTTILMGLTYVFGSILIIYLNSWDDFLFFPLFFYVGAVLIQISLQINIFHLIFLLSSGFFIFTGFLEGGIRYNTPLASTVSIAIFGETLSLLFPTPTKQYIELITTAIAFIYSMFYVSEITRVKEDPFQKQKNERKNDDDDEFIIIL